LSNSAVTTFDSRTRRRLHVLARVIARRARLLLPQHCELCAAPAHDQLICAACTAALPTVVDACPRCALPSAAGVVCGACLAHPPPFDAALAAYAYAFPVDRLLQALKYGGRLALAEWAAMALAAQAAPALRSRARQCAAPMIVPLPLAPARQRERGFNQAREIASRLAPALNLRLASIIERPHARPPQAGLPWALRRSNVRGAFAVCADVAGGHYALIDDVMTTGATRAEAARSLKNAGAARVECWVVARTLPPGRA
jgi:ComF family protein